MRHRGIVAVLCCAMLGGCVALEGGPSRTRPAPVESWRAGSDVDSLLGYFQYVRKLVPSDLGKEHDAARQALQSARSDFNRVRLAMLLSLPGTAIADEPRALELLEPVAKNPSGELCGLASLLAANLQERRRLDASAQGLQQKLDALRSLERNMIERKR